MNKKCKGAILPLVASILIVLILVLGLMVELSWMNYSRFEAQSAADLGSRSALASLYDNQQVDKQLAMNNAKAIGAAVFNLNSRGSSCTASDVDLGFINNKNFNQVNDVTQFNSISASQIALDKDFVPILGRLMAKDDIDLAVASVAEASRVELVICLDVSRSMNYSANGSSKFPPGASTIHEPPKPGSRWFALLDALNDFFATLSPRSGNTKVGLVTFGGGSTKTPRVASPLDAALARREYSLAEFGIRRGSITGRLNGYSNLPALGYGTSIYDGLNHSIDYLTQSKAPASQVILLFTDGNQSQFVNRPSEIIAANRAAQLGITVFTIGYRVKANNLQEIADRTGGKHYSVSSSSQLQTALQDIAKLFKVRVTQ